MRRSARYRRRACPPDQSADARDADLEAELVVRRRRALARGVADGELIAHRLIVGTADPRRSAALVDLDRRAVELLCAERQANDLVRPVWPCWAVDAFALRGSGAPGMKLNRTTPQAAHRPAAASARRDARGAGEGRSRSSISLQRRLNSNYRGRAGRRPRPRQRLEASLKPASGAARRCLLRGSETIQASSSGRSSSCDQLVVDENLGDAAVGQAAHELHPAEVVVVELSPRPVGIRTPSGAMTRSSRLLRSAVLRAMTTSVMLGRSSSTHALHDRALLGLRRPAAFRSGSPRRLPRRGRRQRRGARQRHSDQRRGPRRRRATNARPVSLDPRRRANPKP